MSCYGWERGTITIPSKEWATFRKNLLAAWNADQEETLELAKRVYEKAKEAAKGKRGENRMKAIESAIATGCGGRLSEWGGFETRSESIRMRYEAVRNLLIKSEYTGRDWKVSLQAPKKSNLNMVAISKDATLNLGEAYVTFNNEARQVTWHVYENNHAVETAHDHWFAKKLFFALDRIQWTRGSGGEIVGNDEYNRDNSYNGGGGNYVTRSYGPNVKRRRW